MLEDEVQCNKISLFPTMEEEEFRSEISLTLIPKEEGQVRGGGKKSDMIQAELQKTKVLALIGTVSGESEMHSDDEWRSCGNRQEKDNAETWEKLKTTAKPATGQMKRRRRCAKLCYAMLLISQK